MVSQSRGCPRPGSVFTVHHHWYSLPSSRVHSTLQATEQVWQPMHLLRSNTMATCRSRGAALFSFVVIGISFSMARPRHSLEYECSPPRSWLDPSHTAKATLPGGRGRGARSRRGPLRGVAPPPPA